MLKQMHDKEKCRMKENREKINRFVNEKLIRS